MPNAPPAPIESARTLSTRGTIAYFSIGVQSNGYLARGTSASPVMMSTGVFIAFTSASHAIGSFSSAISFRASSGKPFSSIPPPTSAPPACMR